MISVSGSFLRVRVRQLFTFPKDVCVTTLDLFIIQERLRIST